MATLDYRGSLMHYRRYLAVVQKRPILRASLFLILSLVLLIVLVATALRPTLVTVSGLLGDLRKQKDIETRLDKKINQLAQAQRIYSETQPRLHFLEEALLSPDKFAKWALDLESVANQAGTQIVSINLTDIPGKANFVLIVKGSPEQTLRLVSLLENLRSLVIVEGIQINSVSTIIHGSFATSL